MKDEKARATEIANPHELEIKDMLSNKPIPNFSAILQDKRALSDKPIQNIIKPNPEKTGKK